MHAPVLALLDDCGAAADRRSSRLYEGFAHEHRCTDRAGLAAVCAQIEASQRAGLHAVVLADYEWGAKLQQAGAAALAEGDGAALRVLMFRSLRRLTADETDAWLAQQEGSAEPGPAGVLNLQPSAPPAEFADAVGRIQAAIRDGETYQVNYSYRLRGQAYGSPLALYRRLRQRQPVPYGALIALPDGGWVLSCSPELFVRHQHGRLIARPMKGTAPRGSAPDDDAETANRLALDAKNRAENLMIVDLLRNDLGRIARTGSVQVTSLFAVEPYATLFQMTSTVEAEPRPEVGFGDVLHALFPCGSITGAPKHHTMALIAGLETTPRGLYCGAIGWLDTPAGLAAGAADPADPAGAMAGDAPGPAAPGLGDFCLSVAIRTLTLGAEQAGGRPAQLGVGAGIVLDSRADDELDECRLKARFLTGLDPGFALFETMRYAPEGGLQHVGLHLARLAASAAALGFRFDRAGAEQALAALAAQLTVTSRVRLALAHDGRIELQHAPLAPLPAGIVTLCVTERVLSVDRPLAAHKTTVRQHYDEAVQAAEAVGAFDSLFFNEAGRLVEGGRSNVFVKLDGRWYTPPLADGPLPGVGRALLLEPTALGAVERSLRRNDVLRAEALVACSALRGVLLARLHPVAARALIEGARRTRTA